jgi:hypothetical protein
MLDWNDYHAQSSAGGTTQRLDPKLRELIALAVTAKQ